MEFTKLCGYETIKEFSNRRFIPPGRDTVFLLKKIRQEVFDTIKCDAETLAPDSNFFKTNKENIFFKNASYQTNERAFSGNYSIVTNQNKPLGFQLTIDGIKPCDRFSFHVWRYPARSPIAVCAFSKDRKNYFKCESNNIIAEKNGWGLLSKEFVIPQNYRGSTITFHLANYLETSVWFDDVEIRRLRPMN